MNHRTPSKSTKAVATNRSNSKNLNLVLCGFEDCDFATKYNSNMHRHRQRRSHFLSESDKIEAVQEKARDELAKKMEAKSSTSTDDDTDEENTFDITIPLSQKLSPSKITDYFKPLPKKTAEVASVRKTLDMQSEENANSNGESQAAQQTENKTSKVLEQ